MNLLPSCGRDLIRSTELGDASTGCVARDDTGAVCGETLSFEILKLFNELYADRLKRVEGDSEVRPNVCQSCCSYHGSTEIVAPAQL